MHFQKTEDQKIIKISENIDYTLVKYLFSSFLLIPSRGSFTGLIYVIIFSSKQSIVVLTLYPLKCPPSYPEEHGTK